jgi:pimeloyl-ACP methyl ester carboxylesterase
VLFDYPRGLWPDTLTPANVVADLLAIADAAGAERFAWCGYSWTAVIGLQLALDNDRMTGLICGGWPPIHAPYAETVRILADVQAGKDTTALSMLPPPVVQQFATFYRGLQEFDDVAAQRRISCPRLCFVGSADNVHDTPVPWPWLRLPGRRSP